MKGRRKEEALLPLLLKHLRLPTMNRLWEERAIEGESKGWSGPEYLRKLCEEELAEREQRQLARHMVEAQLPRAKSLENYDFNAIRGVKKEMVLALASGEAWIEEGKNVLVFGSSGVGKTHLAAAIGEKLVGNGCRVFFSRTTDLVQKLQAAKRALVLPAALEKLDKFDCLILDDFGYVKKDEYETNVLFELICERYERKSMLITCNQPFKEWDTIFSDQRMALAAVDRIVHHSILLEIGGESYRKKQALRNAKIKTK